ncbi:MAG: glycosyltransferase [Candidatus Hodarchaeales archaeon]
MLVTSTNHQPISILLNIIILLFEIIAAIYGSFLLFHNAYAIKPIKEEIIFQNKLKSTPLITIIIPTFNPDLYAVETNLLSLEKVTYPNIEIILVDNSSKKEIIVGLENLCRIFSIKLLHRDGTEGFKARNLNYALSHINGEFFVIIDIDQSLNPDILTNFIQYFEKNPKLAFIQAKFDIKNANSVIRICNAILYSFYHEVISLAKDKHRTVLFNGTTACLKTKIIRDIGGFPEETYTEDIGLSAILFSKGYESRYLNKKATTALLPWRLRDLLAGFWRWTHGGTSLLRVHGKMIIQSKELTKTKKIELLLNGSSFVAFSTMPLVALCFLALFIFNYPLIRPELVLSGSIHVSISIAFILPALATLNHLFSCFLGIVESNTLDRLPYLIPYGVASLSLSFFIFLPTLYGLLGIKGPKSKGSTWNKDIHFNFTLLFLFIFAFLFGYASYIAFLRNNQLFLYFLLISLAAFSPIPFIFLDKRINVDLENYNYFSSFQKANKLKRKKNTFLSEF